MKRALKYISMMILTVGITLVCLFLPSELSKLQDRHTFGSIQLEKADNIVVKTNHQTTILEKLNLFINVKKVSVQNDLHHGKYLKIEDIPDVCNREIKKLVNIGILKSTDIDMNLASLKISPSYYWSLDDPTKSAIIWKVYNVDQKNFLKISLDDETGKILSIEGNSGEDFVNTNPQNFVKGLKQYYDSNGDDYIINSIMPESKMDSNSQESIISATFSDDKIKLNLEIQIYPFGWFYLGH